MPTKTFFNLPEEKQKKLLEAIYVEFSRVPFDEVSINQIVRLAGISRGSFYQYFKDKQDVLQYLLTDYRAMLEQQALASLKQTGGDLFQMFLNILDFTYVFVKKERNNAFFKNIFSDIRINDDFLRQQVKEKTLGGFAEKLMPYIDMDLLDIHREEDFGHMLDVLLSLTGETFARVFFDISNYENNRSRYAAQLKLLKRGFLK
ncbi:MAG: TetR family transcriptional regulator [Desulfotomaculaceae bacterium]|nr:TetR family transcriptional regulator [Desulfotomaculaceae bacterium]MDD4766868.1 TetR family transcriptional regulator [Desulfotomaculaceae bacterium]